MEDMRDPRTLLVYGMNGQTLPIEHGYPLRIYIPNRYGMKQPKWITRIEALDHDGAGYWVDRGWSKEARPQILAIIDSVAQDQVVAGRVPIGGIAWAGDRGIRTVEVQVDDGAWDEAHVLSPPPNTMFHHNRRRENARLETISSGGRSLPRGLRRGEAPSPLGCSLAMHT